MKVIKGYDFDDVLLVPCQSKVNSRDEIDLSFNYKDLHLTVPIIASPMKGIVGTEIIKKLSELGGIGILHRFYEDKNKWFEDIKFLHNECSNWGFSIGMNGFHGREIFGGLYAGASIICIDVANGYTDAVARKVEEVRSLIEKCGVCTLLMAGNVVTYYGGVLSLINAGADIIRVGIGSGGLCTTRNMTGVGYPQLSAVDECNRPFYRNNYKIASDGGIRNASDIVKALACGADLVMIGSLFASCYESENSGIIYGMASQKIQEEYFHNVKSVEGIEKEVEKIQPLEKLINDLTWNMKSAYTYMNAKNTVELQKNAKFITVGKGTLKEL